jgi:hypothetical protein
MAAHRTSSGTPRRLSAAPMATVCARRVNAASCAEGGWLSPPWAMRLRAAAIIPARSTTGTSRVHGRSAGGPCCQRRSARSRVRLVAGQGETSARQRGDRAEVTVVERQQPPRPEPVRENHHRKVSQPKIKVGILLIQPGRGAVLIRGQSLNPEPRRVDYGQSLPLARTAPKFDVTGLTCGFR